VAQDNLLYLKLLPFYGVTTTEMHSTLGSLSVTECDIVNHDFLHMFKSMYSQNVLNNFSFDYFTSDSFNEKITGCENRIKLSILHLNIRSLNNNHEELCEFLRTIHHEFDVIILSEIWSYNVSLYSNLLSGYNFLYDLLSASSVGGVGIYVQSSHAYCIIDDFKISSANECPVEFSIARK